MAHTLSIPKLLLFLLGMLVGPVIIIHIYVMMVNAIPSLMPSIVFVCVVLAFFGGRECIKELKQNSRGYVIVYLVSGIVLSLVSGVILGGWAAFHPLIKTMPTFLLWLWAAMVITAWVKGLYKGLAE